MTDQCPPELPHVKVPSGKNSHLTVVGSDLALERACSFFVILLASIEAVTSIFHLPAMVVVNVCARERMGAKRKKTATPQ